MRNGDATAGRCGTFSSQYGTRHAVHGTDGSHSRGLTGCARWRIGTDMSPSNLRVGAVRDKATRPMHAIRTFLGADDDFSNLRGGVS